MTEEGVFRVFLQQQEQQQQEGDDAEEHDVFVNETCETNDGDDNRQGGQVLPLQDRRPRFKRIAAWCLGLIVVGTLLVMFLVASYIHSSATDGTITFAPPVVYYSIYKTDRTGQQVLQMLRLHAYVFAHDPEHGVIQPHLDAKRPAVYGGACRNVVDWQHEHDRKHVPCDLDEYMTLQDERFRNKQQMMAALGLQDVLPFACPIEDDLDNGNAQVLERSDYKPFHFSNPKWLDYIRQHSAYNSSRVQQRQQQTIQRVVVHLRRGDYNPCELRRKYLPNKYFAQVLDAVLATYCTNDMPGCNVTIYTEDDVEPFEDFAEFSTYGQIDTSSSLPAIWDAMITAGILILSQSSFSYVPALLNANGIVLNPFEGFPSLNDDQNWITVGHDAIGSRQTTSMWHAVQPEIDRLVQTRCP